MLLSSSLLRVLLFLSVISTTCTAQQPQQRIDLDNTSLRRAVSLWLVDPIAAESTYGPIEEWSTWQVTDMSRLFQDAHSVAIESMDLSRWNVGQVTDMHHMFAGCSTFDDGNWMLQDWKVDQVTDMRYMFAGATNLTGLSLRTWNTRRVTSMEGMFRGASRFDGDLSGWDLSRVTSVQDMLAHATSFSSSSVNAWNMSHVRHSDRLFYRASSFSQQVCWDQMHPRAKCFECFCGTNGAGFTSTAATTSTVSCDDKPMVHPSIVSYSQACTPNEVIPEGIVAPQLFGSPNSLNDNEESRGGLGGSMVGIFPTNEEEGQGNNNQTAENDNGNDNPTGDLVIVTGVRQQETSSSLSSVGYMYSSFIVTFSSIVVLFINE